MFVARVLTAIVGVPVILVLVWLGGWPFAVAAGLVAALAAGEASRALGGASGSERAIFAFPALGAFVVTVLSILGPNGLLAGLALLVLIAICRSLLGVPTAIWTGQLVAVLYVALPLALFVLLRADLPGNANSVNGGVHLSSGTTWVLLVLTSVWAVDVFAYLVGRVLGRHKLWPRVSPKKTWEGTVAGLLAGILVWIAWSPAVHQPLALAGILGAVTAVAAVVGDLAESALKRSAGLKDASALLPGHGGLLDRLDSLGFATVVVFVCRLLLRS